MTRELVTDVTDFAVVSSTYSFGGFRPEAQTSGFFLPAAFARQNILPKN
ncbi:hypothetical protein KDM89_10030 [Undibacterium sp. LFS511W]|uniref:Uncharacterized protein n=1 Tax=Undibacterium luofuense TaxID=2828733 RepID=A0A941I840_9BURK|nr:hypothetical protein [Undibacterium luofuense]